MKKSKSKVKRPLIFHVVAARTSDHVTNQAEAYGALILPPRHPHPNPE